MTLYIVFIIQNTHSSFITLCNFMLHTIGCTTETKLPTFTLSVVEIIRNPDCTYRLAFNTSMGYDPIVLEQIHHMVMYITGIGSNSVGTQDYIDPYNTVSLIRNIIIRYVAIIVQKINVFKPKSCAIITCIQCT